MGTCDPVWSTEHQAQPEQSPTQEEPDPVWSTEYQAQPGLSPTQEEPELLCQDI